MKIVSVMIVSCLMVMLGCILPDRGPVRQPSVSKGKTKEALNGAVAGGRSAIFVFRMCDLFPERRSLIQVDGKSIGFSYDCRFLRIDVLPGKHELCSRFEWIRGLSQNELARTDPLHYRFVSRDKDMSICSLDAIEGETYYFKLVPDDFSLIGMMKLRRIKPQIAIDEITSNGYMFVDNPVEFPELDLYCQPFKK